MGLEQVGIGCALSRVQYSTKRLGLTDYDDDDDDDDDDEPDVDTSFKTENEY